MYGVLHAQIMILWCSPPPGTHQRGNQDKPITWFITQTGVLILLHTTPPRTQEHTREVTPTGIGETHYLAHHPDRRPNSSLPPTYHPSLLQLIQNNTARWCWHSRHALKDSITMTTGQQGTPPWPQDEAQQGKCTWPGSRPLNTAISNYNPIPNNKTLKRVQLCLEA